MRFDLSFLISSALLHPFTKYIPTHHCLLFSQIELQNLKMVKLFIYFKAEALSSLISFSNFHYSVTWVLTPYHFHTVPRLGGHGRAHHFMDKSIHISQEQKWEARVHYF